MPETKSQTGFFQSCAVNLGNEEGECRRKAAGGQDAVEESGRCDVGLLLAVQKSC